MDSKSLTSGKMTYKKVGMEIKKKLLWTVYWKN